MNPEEFARQIRLNQGGPPMKKILWAILGVFLVFVAIGIFNFYSVYSG